ncbi:TetR family transcriptional regulator [Bacillus sp. M6-12]|uniref:TetR/AcrR family transcriptional regulator n=1 Tax=Bacillus sp. M6-12 TaxID=2054166 RepID=UPI000C755EFD|nr:TetR family transcriptional regulator C-terminal domain-containing protein [Bacillus sp. M6-12]PLS16095.1 TetR family transcriptional regulator [Bacillus sp. M6-12]
MPKIVDHDKQREKVAEAVWRIILRDGFEGATVRKIAEEAGISTGSMRHYFSTQSELFAFSMKLVSQRVKQRIELVRFTGDPRLDLQTILLELLPMDADKSAEMEVWIVFYIKALSDSSLHSLGREIYLEMKKSFTFMIDTLIQHGIAKKDLNRDEAIEILFALVDGLALHGIMQPDLVTPEILKRTIAHHIESICR